MPLERLWADWRSEYVSDPDPGTEKRACVMCNLAAATDDAEALVLERTESTITVMNLYPYGSGHLMVAPIAHIASFELLDERTLIEMTHAQVRALRAIREAYSPDGVNVGANIGRAAGAGVPNHLHVHLLPRWIGDTNFATSIAETRVLPESLRVGYDKLKAAWPR
jgi:ATP adenylyltransferase